MIRLFVLISTALMSVNVQAQTEGGPASEVKTALAEYDRAWNGKDVVKVGDLLDDKYVYFSSVGTLSDKKATLEFLGKRDYKLTFVERSEIVTHKTEKNIAVISSRWKGKGSWSGGEINDDQRCGQVFVKTGGRWKLVSEHCIQIPAR